MKKVKIIFGTLAIALGIAGAFATHATNHKTVTMDELALYWFNDPAAHGSSSVNSTPQTATQRISVTGCDGSSEFCENGYLGSQLNTVNTPSTGVKTAQVPAIQDQIFQPE